MAEKRTIELEIQDNSKTLKQQYKEAVKELQNMVAAYGEMSDEAINAAKRAAELKDQIEDTNDLMKSFKGEGTFIAMGQAMSSVASGFSAIEGGLALVGVESEKIQETMLRVQAAMALAQGLEGLEDAGRAFSVLGTKAKVALQGIKTELIATGIGIFVVALGTAVAYWDDIKAAVGGVSAEQKELNKKVDKQATASKEIYENAQLQENSLRLQGKSEKEILQIRLNKLNASIADEEVRVKGLEQTAKLENEAAQRNYEFMKMYIRFTLEGMLYVVRAIALPIDVLIEGANKVSEALGIGKVVTSNLNTLISQGFDAAADWTAKLLFDPAETKAKSDATIKEAKKGLAQMKSDADAIKLQIKNEDKKASGERVNTEKAAAKETLDLERELIDQRLALMSEGEAKEKAMAEEKARRDKEDLIKSSKDKIVDAQQLADAQKLIDDNLQKDLQGITDKYDKIEYEALVKKNEERIKLEDEQYNLLQKATNSKRDQELFELMQSYDAKFEAAKNNAELEKALTEQFEKEQTDIIKKYAAEEQAIKDANDKKELERKIALRQKTLELAGNTFSALADLAGSFNTKNEKDARKQFQIQKAFNLGAAITNTAMAVTGALTAGGNPIKLATGQQFVEAAIAATIGAANIIKIANSKFGGGGSSSSGGGGGSNAPASSPMTANFNTIGSSGINQLAQLQQTPTQAYVVSGEVTSAQALDRNRVQNATL
jgi:hypothetical protein